MDSILLDVIPLPPEQARDPDHAQPLQEVEAEISPPAPCGNHSYGAYFLEFIHLIFATKIPIFSPTVTNARQTLAGTGTLGRGGQYLVDRIYDNQR